MEVDAQTAKYEYQKTMKKAKKQHWDNFLDDTKNIWQAARYLEDIGSEFTPIPKLRDEAADKEVTNENEIAATLLSSFFPPLPPYPEPVVSSLPPQLSMPPITEEDARLAIFAASPYSAGGIDSLPSIVWQKLWPVLKSQITQLFQSSIEKGKIPDQWKVAKIIPLRKPDQACYTVPAAYRPISLLPTLSKAFESVVTSRIGYLAEEYSLLPGNHFGGLKRKSNVDALVTLQEKIYQDWRNKKVLSLVTFDVKGAFNGVALEVFVDRQGLV